MKDNARAATLALIIASCLMFSCRHQVKPKPDRFQQITRSGYVYQRIDDGAVIVAAATPATLRQALEELGCEKQYICAVQAQGAFYQVTQKIK